MQFLATRASLLGLTVALSSGSDPTSISGSEAARLRSTLRGTGAHSVSFSGNKRARKSKQKQIDGVITLNLEGHETFALKRSRGSEGS